MLVYERKKQLVASCYNTASVLLKITQFTYKTFKWNKLLTWSRCCKLNTFTLPLFVRKNLPFFLSMCTPTPIRSFSLCTQHGGRLISHSNISVGNGKMAEMHAEATPFIRATEKRNIGTGDRENVTFSALWYLTSSNWCLVWNRQKEV